MVELKAAVKLLFATLKKNSKVPDDTKIAIIPFSTVVNVGTEYKDAPWIAYDGTITKRELGRLRRRPRSAERREGYCARRERDQLPGGRMRLAGEGPAADQRLDRARGQGRLA